MSLILVFFISSAGGVLLQNAADPGTDCPLMGLGTAGGATDNGFAVHPECWASCLDSQCLSPAPCSRCAMYTEAAIASWFALGGRRLDSANSYRNQDAVGRAINTAAGLGVPRSAIFFQSKVGPGNPMGYNETLNQTATILRVANVTYIDNLMLHWPSCETGNGCQASTDPPCNWGAPTYNDAACRISTWRALLWVWRAGLARSVGVSNFNISHLEEIRAAGLTLPALNQVSLHLYHSRAERPLLDYCKAHGILFNSWTPLARPDSWVMQPPCAPSPDRDPGAMALAARYNATGAALQLAWAMQEGVAVNPRTQNVRPVAVGDFFFPPPLYLTAPSLAHAHTRRRGTWSKTCAQLSWWGRYRPRMWPPCGPGRCRASAPLPLAPTPFLPAALTMQSKKK